MTLAPEAGTSGKELKIVRGACPHDCPDTCAMLYHVEDGKLIDVKGDPVQWLKRGKTIAPIGLEDTARFHHYFVRSQAHWEKRMAIPFNAAKRADTKFEVYDRNDVYDPIVVDKFGDVLARIAAFKAEHGV